MSYTYHGATGLIKLPGKTITTFTDNEQRVDIQYACRKTYVDTAIGLLKKNSQVPGESGFVIEFDPQVTIRDDGFANIVVSGYRRKDAAQSISGAYALNLALKLPNYNYFPGMQGILKLGTHSITMSTLSVTQNWIFKTSVIQADQAGTLSGKYEEYGSRSQDPPTQANENFSFLFTPIYEQAFFDEFPTNYEISYSGNQWVRIMESDSTEVSYGQRDRLGVATSETRISNRSQQWISVPQIIYVTIQQFKYKFVKSPFKAYQVNFSLNGLGGNLSDFRLNTAEKSAGTSFEYLLTS